MRTVSKISFCAIAAFALVSCAEVDNGFRGVAYKPYAGGLDPTHVYSEGVDMGISWLLNDMIEYDCRQKTMTIELTPLDSNQMEVKMEASVFYRVMPDKIGYLHKEKGRDYEKTYIEPNFKGAIKNVVGNYTAQKMVTSKRDIIETEVKTILDKAFLVNHIICDDIIISDVNLPPTIREAITEKMTQDEKNLTAEKKKVQEENLASAKVAKAKGDSAAKVIEAQAEARYINEVQKALASSPNYVELKKVEKWDGTFGTNNVFSSIPMIRGLQ